MLNANMEFFLVSDHCKGIVASVDRIRRKVDGELGPVDFDVLKSEVFYLAVEVRTLAANVAQLAHVLMEQEEEKIATRVPQPKAPVALENA